MIMTPHWHTLNDLIKQSRWFRVKKRKLRSTSRFIITFWLSFKMRSRWFKLIWNCLLRMLWFFSWISIMVMFLKNVFDTLRLACSVFSWSSSYNYSNVGSLMNNFDPSLALHKTISWTWIVLEAILRVRLDIESRFVFDEDETLLSFVHHNQILELRLPNVLWQHIQ